MKEQTDFAVYKNTTVNFFNADISNFVFFFILNILILEYILNQAGKFSALFAYFGVL